MEKENEKTISPTWIVALTIWWSSTWRRYLWGIMCGTLVGLFCAIFVSVFGVSDNTIGGVFVVTYILASVVMSVLAIKKTLGLKYGYFRIDIVEKKDYKNFFQDDDE